MTLLEAVLLVLLGILSCSASAEQCFVLQKLYACKECLNSLSDSKATVPKMDCWTAVVRREWEASATLTRVGQVLVEPSSKDCHLLDSECPLKCLPSSAVAAGFESWLPCQPPGSPAPLHLIFTRLDWDAILTPSGKAYVISMSTGSSAGQPDVFRSDLLDNLDALMYQLPMRQIHLVVYKANAPALMLTFDASGPGLNATNWFSSARLKSSWPVTDIAGRTFNYFSIAGHVSTVPGWSHERRFFINYYYGGCPLDQGVLMLMDTDDVCDFAKGNFTAAPRILFTSSINGAWQTDVQRADRLSVFVS